MSNCIAPAFLGLTTLLSTTVLKSRLRDPKYVLTRGDLIACDHDPTIVKAQLRALGIDAGLNRKFPCVLPGHNPNNHGLAIVRRRSDGTFTYTANDCSLHACGGFLLAELRLLAAYRKFDLDRPRNNPELVTWHLKLLGEAGLLIPAPILAPSIPHNAPLSFDLVYSGFRELLGMKWRHSPGDGTTYSRRFAAAWCAVSEGRASREIRWMLDLGFIERAGEIKGQHHNRPIPIYLPGARQIANGFEKRRARSLITSSGHTRTRSISQALDTSLYTARHNGGN